MQPAYKAPNIEAFLDALSLEQHGRKRTDSIRADICVDCGQPATEFTDELSRKEYTISGLCQSCQNYTFNGTEPEAEPKHVQLDFEPMQLDYENRHICPNCGLIVEADFVDVGVGVDMQVSPYACPACGWHEDCPHEGPKCDHCKSDARCHPR